MDQLATLPVTAVTSAAALFHSLLLLLFLPPSPVRCVGPLKICKGENRDPSREVLRVEMVDECLDSYSYKDGSPIFPSYLLMLLFVLSA